MSDQPGPIKRRRRAPRELIADGEMRNITFRVGSRAYNMLVEAANLAKCSISDLGENLIEHMLGDKAEEKKTRQGPWSPLSSIDRNELSDESNRVIDTLAIVLKTYDKHGWTSNEKSMVGAYFAAMAVINKAMPLPAQLHDDMASEETWSTSEFQSSAVAGSNLGAILWSPDDFVAHGAPKSDIMTRKIK